MEDQQVGQETVQDAPQKVVINGAEYDPTEAQELIGLGSKARDYEKQWNSPIDSLASAYGKSQSELQALRAEAAQYKSQLATFQQKQEQGTETQGDVEKAREAARKLGLILQDDIKDKYISTDKFDEMLNKRLEEREQVKAIISKAESLEKEINGDDGRPKFNQRRVLAYAQAYGFNDVQKAYEDMYKDELAEWSKTQVQGQKRPAMKTISNSTSTKRPTEAKPTDDNFKDMIGQALRGEI